jgi:hypothetical protein
VYFSAVWAINPDIALEAHADSAIGRHRLQVSGNFGIGLSSADMHYSTCFHCLLT